MHGALAVVEAWQEAVNARHVDRVLATTADDVAIVGPRGTARGHAMLADWIARAGFTAIPRRWFCGRDGEVVVEQDARWAAGDAVRVASAFVVRDGRVARYQRFDTVTDALAAMGLTTADEVPPRSP